MRPHDGIRFTSFPLVWFLVVHCSCKVPAGRRIIAHRRNALMKLGPRGRSDACGVYAEGEAVASSTTFLWLLIDRTVLVSPLAQAVFLPNWFFTGSSISSIGQLQKLAFPPARVGAKGSNDCIANQGTGLPTSYLEHAEM